MSIGSDKLTAEGVQIARLQRELAEAKRGRDEASWGAAIRTAEIAHWRERAEKAEADFEQGTTLTAERDALAKEAVALREALFRYGIHKGPCASQQRRAPGEVIADCTCGYEVALAASTTAGEWQNDRRS